MMRFVLFLFALLVAVSATSRAHIARQSLPSCATSCLTNANTGNCTPSDDSCLCKSESFVNSTTLCIESSCTGSDLQNAEAYAQQLCLAVGVTLTATPTSSAAPASSATPTSHASSSTASSSPTASSSSGASMTSSISVFTGVVIAFAIAAML